jgi:hypothetical protein
MQSAAEIERKLLPLVRRKWPAAPPETIERHRENLSLVYCELFERWQRDPRLDGRVVDFDEYLVTKAITQLREVDRHQRPDLYDKHGRYLRPEERLVEFSLTEAEEGEASRRVGRAEEDGAERRLWLVEEREELEGLTPEERLARGMAAQKIPVASQPNVLRLLLNVQSGSAVHGRHAGAALGRRSAATAPLLAAKDLLEQVEDERPPTKAPSFRITWQRL